jgi:hypothetical protein
VESPLPVGATKKYAVGNRVKLMSGSKLDNLIIGPNQKSISNFLSYNVSQMKYTFD